jgi:hypothetical protein
MKGWCVLLILAAASGCAQDAGVGESPGDAPSGAEVATESSTESGSGADPVAGEVPEVGEVIWQIFDETREPEGPLRTTLHVLVPRDGSRDELRKALTEALELAAQKDTTLVAARAIGYRAEQTGPADARMVPFVWAEWLPSDGWYRSTEASRRTIHRTYFYHNLAPEW